MASLLLLEAALRIAPQSEYFIWPPNLAGIFRPRPGVMPGIEGESRFSINSLGMRGDEFSNDDTYRILAFGGSTTECLFLDDMEAWPRLLQEHLNTQRGPEERVWVGNVGSSARSTRHHIVQVDRLLSQHQGIDAVLLLIGANDFLHRLQQDELYRPFPGVDALDAREYDALMFQAFASRLDSKSTGSRFYEQTEIWRRLQEVERRYLSSPDPALIQDDAGRSYERWRANRRAASSIRTGLPDLSSALNEYARNVGRIIEIAQARGVRVVFVTQPYMWRPGLARMEKNLLWLGGVGNYLAKAGSEYYSVMALARGMKGYNSELLQICQGRNVECVDLEGQMPKSRSFFYDGLHLNEAGARRTAEVLGEYFQRTYRAPLDGAQRLPHRDPAGERALHPRDPASRASTSS